MKINLFRLIKIGIAVLLISGCQNSPVIETGPRTVRWEPTTDGYFQFFTNDATYHGYSFWRTFSKNDSVFSQVTAEVKKISGNPIYGFGIIFAYTDSNNNYQLVIDSSGYYTVRKVVNGEYTSVIKWMESPNLFEGLNVVNKISITRTEPGNFAVSFNGILSTSFTDTALKTDSFGPYADVGKVTEEAFPSTPVDVRIKITAPIVLPDAPAGQTSRGLLNTQSAGVHR